MKQSSCVVERKRKKSKIIISHYIKLIVRSALFAAALISYCINRIKDSDSFFGKFQNNTVFMWAIWALFVAEMIMRLFPSRLASVGCQKQFLKNYREKHSKPKPVLQARKVTVSMALIWIVPNVIIGVLHCVGIINQGLMLLLCLFYSVGDIVCILFFCPFQWYMKNRCCTVCRIYNWDYAMMFTPFAFIPHFYTWSLFGVALILLIQWEYLVHKHPERFSPDCNETLSCDMCEEKLCRYKRQFWGFLLRKGNKTRV